MMRKMLITKGIRINKKIRINKGNKILMIYATRSMEKILKLKEME